MTINISFSQKNKTSIIGSWIKYKIEMKDGSKIIDRFLNDSSYVNFIFNEKQLCINESSTYIINPTCFDYTLNNNLITTSETSKYLIEKSDNDTLVLSEQINQLEDDKCKRFYFIRQSALIDKFKKENVETKNLVAKEFFTPTLKSSLCCALNNAFKNHYSDFKLKGTIFIKMDDHKVKTQIAYCSTSDSTKINIIKKTIDDSYGLWELEGFKEYKSIAIPFVLKSEITANFGEVTMKLFDTTFYDLDNSCKCESKKIKESGEFFDRGKSAYLRKKYKKAIEYYSKSYALDPINIDALYNRAAVYYELNQNEKACNDLQELAKLGQTNGKNLYQKYCKVSLTKN